MAKESMTKAQLRAHISQDKSKKTPAKMQPMKIQTDTDRLQQAEREIKALWNAHNRLLCDLNTLSVRCTPSTTQPATSAKII